MVDFMQSQANQYHHLNQERITGFSREVALLVITSQPFSDTLHAELKCLNRNERGEKKKPWRELEGCLHPELIQEVIVFTFKP